MIARQLSSRTRPAAIATMLVAMKGADAMGQSPEASSENDASHDNGVFVTIAEDMLATIIRHYSADDGTGLYRPTYPQSPDDRPYAYLWPFSAFVSALGARARYRLDDQSIADFIGSLEALEHYFDAESDPAGYDSYPPADGGGNKYYDDNQWLGMDFVHAYRLTGNAHWLEKSVLMWEFSLSGWSDDDMGGGIYWRQNDIGTKNTCSNGPAAVHAMMLYEETGDHEYLEWALRIMEWLQQLYDSATGVYYDHISIDGRIDRTPWTYNTGTPMEASAMLYRATGDIAWLQKARALAEASIDYFASTHDRNGVRNFPPSPWFNAVLHRAYCMLYDVDPDFDHTYIDALPALLQRAWESNRTEEGFLPPDWVRTAVANNPLDLLEQAAVVEVASLAALYSQ